MGSRRRKKKQSRETVVQATRKRNLLPIVAALAGSGLLVVVILLNLPGCESKTAKAPAKPTPAAPAAANDPGTSSTAATPTAKPAAPTTEPANTSTTADRPATIADAKPGFDVLKGRWLRPDSDGNYVLEIKSVDANGKMDASYSNPRRINVSKAEASRDGAATKVFVELRDVNYPGSTYNLTYDPQSDQFQGIYYQAALQQSFEVIFVRMKSN